MSEESEIEEYPNLETICRFCLKEFSEIQIFGDTKTSLPYRIMTCINLEIKAEDVPCQMCVECRIQIEKFFVFRKRAIFYDQKFRKHLRLRNAGRKSTVFEHNESDDEDDELDIKDSVAIIEEYDNQKKQYTETLNEQQFKEKEENIRKSVEEEMLQQFKKKLRELRNEMVKKIREEESSKIISEFEEFLNVKKNLKKKFKSEPVVEQQNGSSANDDQFIYIVSCAKETKPRQISTTDGEMDENNYDFPIDEAEDQLFSEENTYETLDICEEEEEAEELKMIENNDINSLPENEMLETDYTVNETSGNEIKASQQQNDKISLNNSSADKKIISERGIRVYKCDKCAQSFTKGLALERHKNVHNKNGVFCPDCDKFFPTKSSLEKHARTHSGLRPFQCGVCEKSFTQKEVLQRHMFTHYGPKSKPHQCPYCELAFVQKQVLNQHINMKHSENPIIPKHGCEFCCKKFLYASGLSRHLLIHTGVVFSCNSCSKKFTDKSSLKRHLKLHVKKEKKNPNLSIESDRKCILSN